MLFDLDADSLDDIDHCALIDDGAIPEMTIDKADYHLFAEYHYDSDYSSENLRELLIFRQKISRSISA